MLLTLFEQAECFTGIAQVEMSAPIFGLQFDKALVGGPGRSKVSELGMGYS